jgi:flagellar basal-body rod protein FlgF
LPVTGKIASGIHHEPGARALKIKRLTIGTSLAWLTVMDNALMLGLQTQRVLQRRMDVAANNLANVSTSGFKADTLLLEEADATSAHADEDPRQIRFVRDIGIMHGMEQGPIAMTGNALDVAIEGEGFFMVEGFNGEPQYTRDGAFSIAGDGRLVSSDGRAVLNSGGAPIVLDPQGESPSIGRDGVIRVAGVEAGRIGVVSFAAPGALTKVGDNLWDAQGQQPGDFEGVVVQGALEGSNVRPVLELTRLIEISRAYASAARLVSGADELRRSAIERLGR